MTSMTEEEKLAAETAGSPFEMNDELAADGGADSPRITALEAELAEAKAAVLYAHAEAQNVRRRSEKEAIDARAYAVTAFARDLLSVADNLTRALAAIPAEMRSDDKMKGLVAGLEATGRELDGVFQRHGITRVDAVGQMLDPNRHQAMLEMPSDEEPGKIIQEMQTGYMIRERLLRPSMVAVAKKPD